MRTVLLHSLAIMVLFGCATHELVLSRILAPAASSTNLGFSPTLFRARVDKGVLQVWSRVRRSDDEYTSGFDMEFASAAALCGFLARNDRTFESEWNYLKFELTNEYGGQWRWKNTVGYITVRLSRKELFDLREQSIPISAYPKYWHIIVAYKVGPPDYVPHELLPDNARTADGL
jgi:hypothetical protein